MAKRTWCTHASSTTATSTATGEGFFARLDSPAHAVEAARAVRQAMTALDLEIRAGIHTGECEIEGTSLTGMAVHIASRIQAAAQSPRVRYALQLSLVGRSQFVELAHRCNSTSH